MTDFRLKVFYSVASNLSFTKAAQELGISQPAVSKHIQELEQEKNVLLFNRTKMGLEITDAGRLLLLHAEKILENYRLMEFDMNLLNRSHSGELRLGATSTIAHYLLPACMASFSARFRHIKLSLFEGNSTEVEQALSDGKIDLGMVELPLQQSSLRYTPFMCDDILLVASACSQFCDKEVVTLDGLLSLPLVINTPQSDIYRGVEQMLGYNNIDMSSLNIVISLDSTEALKRYVEYSDCYAFVSAQAIAEEALHRKFKIVPIEGVDMRRRLSYVRNVGVTQPLVKDFIDYMQEWLVRGE